VNPANVALTGPRVRWDRWGLPESKARKATPGKTAWTGETGPPAPKVTPDEMARPDPWGHKALPVKRVQPVLPG